MAGLYIVLPQRYKKNIAIQQKNHLFFIPMLYNSEILCNFAKLKS